MRSRIWIGTVGLALAAALWIDFAAVRAIHVWGGVPGTLMVMGQFAGLLAIPIALWMAIRRDHPDGWHVHLHRHRPS